jgi:hypothetical protein
MAKDNSRGGYKRLRVEQNSFSNASPTSSWRFVRLFSVHSAEVNRSNGYDGMKLPAHYAPPIVFTSIPAMDEPSLPPRF